jgi:hypothetical protein
MNLEEVCVHEDLEWIKMAEDKDQLQALVKKNNRPLGFIIGTPSSTEVKNFESIPPVPHSLHGVMLH